MHIRDMCASRTEEPPLLSIHDQPNVKFFTQWSLAPSLRYASSCCSTALRQSGRGGVAWRGVVRPMREAIRDKMVLVSDWSARKPQPALRRCGGPLVNTKRSHLHSDGWVALGRTHNTPTRRRGTGDGQPTLPSRFRSLPLRHPRRRGKCPRRNTGKIRAESTSTVNWEKGIVSHRHDPPRRASTAIVSRERDGLPQGPDYVRCKAVHAAPRSDRSRETQGERVAIVTWPIRIGFQHTCPWHIYWACG